MQNPVGFLAAAWHRPLVPAEKADTSSAGFA
jgi:hypothetical protein